jgi:hypothetical protein
MNAYIARRFDISLTQVITVAAAQLDMRPRDLLDCAINEEIEVPDLDGAIGDLESAMDEGEKVGIVALVCKLIADLGELELMTLKSHLPI